MLPEESIINATSTGELHGGGSNGTEIQGNKCCTESQKVYCYAITSYLLLGEYVYLRIRVVCFIDIVFPFT